MSKTLQDKRVTYLQLLAKVGEDLRECEEKSLVELRDLVDEYYPLRIVQVSGTSVGKSVSIEIVKKAA